MSAEGRQVMRAAIYGRKSQEKEEAVERQVETARAFATQHGWSVSDAHVFTDNGISGAEFIDRPGFTALMSAVKSKPRPFEELVLMAPDRMGREQYRTNLALLDIVEAGVRVFFYSNGDELKLDTPIAKVMLGMQNFAGEDYRAQIANKTREALRAKAQAGHVTGTRTYGYDHVAVSDHVERRINPDEAAVVVRIFETAAEGHGNRRIVNTLSAENVPAPGRKGWSKQVLKTLLVNDLYRGVVCFGRSRSAARGGSASRREAAPKDEWTTVAMLELRSVSDELWAKVQRRKDATRAHFRRSADGRLLSQPESGLTAEHLLNGIGRCGVCGGALTYMSRGTRTRRSRYYCATRLHRGSCENGKGVPKVELDNLVRDKLTALCDDEDKVQSLIDESRERYARKYAAQSEERANVEKETTKLEAEISRLVSALAAGTASADITGAINERRSKVEALTVKLSEPVALVVDKLAVVEGLRRAGLMVLADDREARQALRKLGVDRVVVTPDDAGGWTVEGVADLARLVGVNKGSAGLPAIPRLPKKRRERSARPSTCHPPSASGVTVTDDTPALWTP